jgi:ribosomal-protein-alanine N-acetyltransferase
MIRTNFIPFPQLSTERLTLRQLSIKDEHEIFSLRTDESVNRYIDRERAKSLEDARRFVDKINTLIIKGEGIMWGVTQKDSPSLIGTVGLWNFSKVEQRSEIGYELLPVYQGRGIMQEVVTRIIQFGFEDMALQSMVAVVNPDNLQSVKLLQKNHFTSTSDPGNDKDQMQMVTYILHRK